MKFLSNLISTFGSAMGRFTATFYQAGRDTIDMILTTILPFMIFVSAVVGIILESGIGDLVANTLSPFASSLIGLLFISVIASIPILSPLLGPGAVIAQVVGVLIGTQIGMGNIDPKMALPALFAINPQVMADFVPVALSLMEAEPETVELGVPAMLVSRMVTGPLGVVVGYLLSFGLFS